MAIMTTKRGNQHFYHTAPFLLMIFTALRPTRCARTSISRKPWCGSLGPQTVKIPRMISRPINRKLDSDNASTAFPTRSFKSVKR
ncbi:uncharacterized protein BCR38DRAFT_441793 [Pseudomassariella vexata]|uniref:Secreted protein n=1 Tax=Pseudomassariella vexata TaxID=1141098 RepID=A0A1Y2DN10_9PEZI|nr:uncharacterized protein BCR38DRAFT_441793 [Pseudomassariella vexata]ORY60641.1 hypothetical protein BCR38DRAFT_441793 [Pseudomassariella vexata]